MQNRAVFDDDAARLDGTSNFTGAPHLDALASLERANHFPANDNFAGVDFGIDAGVGAGRETALGNVNFPFKRAIEAENVLAGDFSFAGDGPTQPGRRRAGEDGGWKPPPGGKAGCRHEDALILQGGDRGRHGLRREAAPGAPQEDQKRNFNANCNWREEPESATGKRVLVMLEKLAAVENTVAPVGLKGPGWPKLG